MTCNIVITGHVDHGKSTVLGRILLDHGRVPADRLERVRSVCKSKAIEFEPAFLLDALKEEQEQGISIDTTRAGFSHDGQYYSIIDAPGHLDFLKNMASGASAASLALLVVDVNEGVRSQTERHLKVLSVLGLNKVVVAINKMDTVGYSQSAYEGTAQATRKLLEAEKIECIETVPISALLGSNISVPADKLNWYLGLPLVSLLCRHASPDSVEDRSGPLRMVLQDIYKFGTERHFAGKVTDGTLATGMEVFFSPSGKLSRILGIVKADGTSATLASKGDSVALTLDDQIFVERGEVISLADNRPIVDTELIATIVWLSASPLDVTKRYLLKVGTNQCFCSLSATDENCPDISVKNGDVASIKISLDSPIAFDINGSAISRFVLCTEYDTVAAGKVVSETRMLKREMKPAQSCAAETGFVQRAEHELINGHKGAVLWLTGLSGAGKSTLARALERSLFTADIKCVVLDGDNMRKGICADLGFTPADRSENLRRIAHTARLFLDAGFVAIVACISPYERDRREARAIIGEPSFNEVFVFCPIEVCAARDIKGLYKKQKEKEVAQLTGIDAPYQPPAFPEARFDSSTGSVEDGVSQLLDLLATKNVIELESRVAIPGGDHAKIR